MELKQANLYGGYKLVVVKNNKENTLKKQKLNLKLKQKIKILYELYEALYEKQEISLLDNRDIIINKNIVSYPEERQAELIEMIYLSIYDIDKRIEKMKEVLNV